MSIFIRSCIFFLVFYSLTGCQKSEFKTVQKKYIDEMSWLYSAKPEDYFKKSIENNDFRFLGIYGYTLTVPEVSKSCLDIDKDIKPIKGTTDTVFGEEHSKLISMATKFAKDYNLRMKEYRANKQGFVCKP